MIISDASDRRQSNEGHRKLDLPERLLIFLTRLRRKEPFKELGFQYGCGRETARRYFLEILELFHNHLVPQLVFPRPPEELRNMSRKEVSDMFPNLLAILDATNWEQLQPQNFWKIVFPTLPSSTSTLFKCYSVCTPLGYVDTMGTDLL